MILVIYGVILGLHELFVKLTGKRFDYPLVGMEWLIGVLYELILISCGFMVGKGVIVIDKGYKATRMWK
jgi:hypothetical protein